VPEGKARWAVAGTDTNVPVFFGGQDDAKWPCYEHDTVAGGVGFAGCKEDGGVATIWGKGDQANSARGLMHCCLPSEFASTEEPGKCKAKGSPEHTLTVSRGADGGEGTHKLSKER